MIRAFQALYNFVYVHVSFSNGVHIRSKTYSAIAERYRAWNARIKFDSELFDLIRVYSFSRRKIVQNQNTALA